ncbi:MAG: radical SAM protein [Myxococcales bacterium]|nr:radical SAM protein [Myxococcales bacterium]MCB9754476.1 radical SAM protein [Myxococcales bacterium]
MAGIERVCISVNSVCNLKCTYCYFFLKPDHLPGPGALSCAEIGVILDNVQRYGRRPAADKPIKVNFVGSGEPLIHWREIRDAIKNLNSTIPDHSLRFYTVTNGLLLNDQVVGEMKALDLKPSVSLDGPEWMHDRTRLRHNGRGSHRAVMRGIAALRRAGVEIAINTTLNRDVINHLEAYFDFIEEAGFSKIIFDRLVDVPAEHSVSTAEFYRALQDIASIKERRRLDSVEIGNLEAYRRAIAGRPDRVCTMFGSTCGSGFHNIIYMQREVYPCGRMFGQQQWVLGRFDEPLELFPKRMAAKIGSAGCTGEAPEETAGPDCLIERLRDDYDGSERREFVGWFRGQSQLSGCRSD